MTVTDELRRQILKAAGLGSGCSWPIVVLDKERTDQPPTPMGEAGYWVTNTGQRWPDFPAARTRAARDKWIKVKATFRVEVGIEFVEYLIAQGIK